MQKKEQLYLYYSEKGILPTYSGFNAPGDLSRYARQRQNIFSDKLHLPPQIFRDSRLVEFGPDSGENSLVFASWGAKILLVEPNLKAHPHILEYFRKFGLEDRLIALEKTDLESFKSQEKFDIIAAEGFIYTVRPESIWVNLFDRILEENGFFVISYCEFFGSLLELLLKAVYSRAKNITGADSRDIAWKLFQGKWNSIPHTRSFDSWLMDVLDNPFVRARYLFNAATLYSQLVKAGFSLYSSWPVYSDGMNIYWAKKNIAPEEKLAGNLNFLKRSCLSFVFGRKIFLSCHSQATITRSNRIATELVLAVDRLIDEFDANDLRKCAEYTEEIKKILQGREILINSQEEKNQSVKLCDSILKIFKLLAKKDVDGLESLCNSDAPFINFWGQPYHYAVFKKTGDSRA